MPDSTADQAKKALNMMATAGTTIREAISKSLPVAPNQVMTVQIPGTVINYNDFVYDLKAEAFKPLFVRQNEAMLVDGMVPLSKIAMGKTGKSVARSYVNALDTMIPVEASVSGLIATTTSGPIDPRNKIIKDRYDGAMAYLTSQDTESGRSKLSKYVEKQDMWTKTVQLYADVQEQQQKIAQQQYPRDPDKARELFMTWLQVHSRDFKAAIQARYMDWVVHGFKFNVEFNFGIVDISSGMARVENSKEAYRNLVLVGLDGFTEYHQVNLTPSNWATLVKNKIEAWNSRNALPTPSEIKAEIRRLRNLLYSHQTLRKRAEEGQLTFVDRADQNPADNKELTTAYNDVYEQRTNAKQKSQAAGDGDKAAEAQKASALSAKAFQTLVSATNKWNDAGIKATNTALTNLDGDNKATVLAFLDNKIKMLNDDITDLQNDLKQSTLAPVDAVDGQGNVISSDEARKDPDLFKKPETNQEVLKKEEPSPWTKISAKVSMSEAESSKMTEESATSVAAKASWGLWNASGGFSTSSSSAKAMSAMANLDVELSMECMLVEIDRPWLHPELFVDKDLDVGTDFVESDENIPAEFQQFSSYPTAFVLAADVELSFSGDCSSMQSSMEASSTEANLSVGWGPFGVSASHKQSKTSQKTRTESTATGMKISLQAPQIIGWVQTLVPQLPRPKNDVGTTSIQLVQAPKQST